MFILAKTNSNIMKTTKPKTIKNIIIEINNFYTNESVLNKSVAKSLKKLDLDELSRLLIMIQTSK